MHKKQNREVFKNTKKIDPKFELRYNDFFNLSSENDLDFKYRRMWKRNQVVISYGIGKLHLKFKLIVLEFPQLFFSFFLIFLE